MLSEVAPSTQSKVYRAHEGGVTLVVGSMQDYPGVEVAMELMPVAHHHLLGA